MNRKSYCYIFIANAIMRLAFTIISIQESIVLAVYCCMTAALYTILVEVLKSNKHSRLCFNICFTELLLFGSSGIIVYGNGCGFILIILSLIPITSYVLFKSEYFSNKSVYVYDIINALVAITFPIIGLSKDPFVEISQPVRFVIYTLNLMLSVVLITLFDIMFTIGNKKEHDRLEELNEVLENEANYDILTGKLNRRSFNDKFRAQLEYTRQESLRQYLIMIDIDHFKIFNDTYGHDFGDIVLKGVSDTLQSQLRKTDNLFRWGGEEFLISLSCNDHDLKTVTKRLLESVASAEFEDNGTVVHVTISAGLAVYDDRDDVTRSIEKADVALYYSKEHGRNKCTYYTQRME